MACCLQNVMVSKSLFVNFFKFLECCLFFQSFKIAAIFSSLAAVLLNYY